MLLALITFILISSGCFLILTRFVRAGSNQEEENTIRQRRPLLFGGLTPALAGLLPVREETRKRYVEFLRQAGHYESHACMEFLALRNTLVLGTLLLLVALIVVATEPGDAAMYQIGIGGTVVLALLFALPRLVLETLARNRTRRIEESLPDALDMVTMCTSAGLPLQHALSKVSSEVQSTHPDLAYELRIVGRHADASSLNAAIQQFAKRINVPEIHSVAAMVWQAEQQGASVTGAFQAFADQVRLTRKQRAEETANRASVRMLFPLVFCLAPAVYLLLLSPAVLDLREFFRREKQPGGALSASQQNVEAMMANPASGPGSPRPNQPVAPTAPQGAAGTFPFVAPTTTPR